ERRKGIMTTEEQHLEEYRKLPVAITTEVESYAGWLMDAENENFQPELQKLQSMLASPYARDYLTNHFPIRMNGWKNQRTLPQALPNEH
ncbi:6330_t:CDS:2, partial [Entrophospora sp. SA101]